MSLEEIIRENFHHHLANPTTKFCQLLNENRWVVVKGHFHLLYARMEKNQTQLVIPGVSIYDVADTEHWTTTSSHTNSNGHTTTTTHHHYRIYGRKIQTSSLSISNAWLQTSRALLVGKNRYFLSRTKGPLSAARAFQAIINPKLKRWDAVELLMDKVLLEHVLGLIQSIRNMGGLATCTVAKTGSWYVVRNLILVGPAERIDPSNKFTSSGYEIEKIVFAGRGPSHNQIVEVGTANRVLPYKTTRTVPVDTKKITIASETELAIPCRVQGWKLNLNDTDIGRIDYECDVMTKRPLRGIECYIGYRTSKSNCPEIIVKPQGDERQLMDRISLKAPLSILGATIGRPDGSDHVRVKKSFRKVLRGALGSKSPVSVHFVPVREDSGKAKKHSAGWKGSYRVFRLRPMVSVDNQWYWMDTLKSCGQIRPYPKRRIRYLQFSSMEAEDSCSKMTEPEYEVMVQ